MAISPGEKELNDIQYVSRLLMWKKYEEFKDAQVSNRRGNKHIQPLAHK